MSVQEETWYSGANRVHQTGKWLNLKQQWTIAQIKIIIYLLKKKSQVMRMLMFTCKDVPIMISRSALGKSFVWRKYFCGRSSPKNTTSGLTVAAQNVHMGTLSFIIARCKKKKKKGENITPV